MHSSMQPPVEKFHCRSCHSIEERDLHSLKECIKSKRALQRAKEDLEFERNEFINKNNLKRKSKSGDLTTIEPVDSQTTSTINLQNRKVVVDPAGCKKPRTLRIRKIAPIQRCYGSTHHYPAKKQSNE